MFFRTVSLFALGLLMSFEAGAHEYKAGDIRIAHPHARPSIPGQTSGVAYLGLENTGKAGDKLIRASTTMAKSVEMHTMSMDKDIMRMREVGAIDVPPGAKIVMQPGDGYHFMLIDLKQPLKAGDKFPMTLVFEKFGPLEVSISVDDPSKKVGPAAPAEHQH
jgi:copper(I)-binding protein